MWRSVTCSERPARGARCTLLAAVIAAAAAGAAAAAALTPEEAAALAYPGCVIERGAVFLTAAQVEAASALAGERMESALVTRFTARCGGVPAGAAYLDTHRVRTLAQTLLVAIDAGGAVRRVEVLAFAEPHEYLPRQPWYEQLEARTLDGELALRGAVRPIAGATLTVRATVAAVRRVLAVHRVLAETAR